MFSIPVEVKPTRAAIFRQEWFASETPAGEPVKAQTSLQCTTLLILVGEETFAVDVGKLVNDLLAARRSVLVKGADS